MSREAGSVQGEIDALNRLMDLSILNLPRQWSARRTFLVPGHGHVYDKWTCWSTRPVTIVRDEFRTSSIREDAQPSQIGEPTLG